MKEMVKMSDFHPTNLKKKSDDELQEALYEISNEVIRNDAVQHRAIINAIVINQILLLRFSENQERRNTRIQYINIFVAVCALIASVVAIIN